jgi:hypothetical protein
MGDKLEFRSCSFNEWIHNNLDQAAILAFLVSLAFNEDFQVTPENQIILAALRRSSEDFRHMSVEELSGSLQNYSSSQIEGLVNNVKGIAHEMEFVRIENADGDGVYASLYPNTNNPGYDIQLFDDETGKHWPVQLKATDDTSYVQQWIDQHPDGEILVTEELAEKMGISGSGVENGELTADVKDFVDALIENGNEESLSHYFPHLTIVSSALIVWELWQRYQRGEISLSKFKFLAAIAVAGKGVKVGVLMAAMSVPGLNVAVGTAMLAQLIHVSTQFATGQLDKMHLPGYRKQS